MNSKRRFLYQSISFHALVIGAFFIVIFISQKNHKTPQKYNIEIKEVSQQSIKPEINLAQPLPEPQPLPTSRKVFGITKDTLTAKSDSNDGVAVKLGTTLAKEMDDELIDEKDAIGLPVPTAEYMVSQMPRIKSQVRIPYPPDAKKNNVEGSVMMELLIDEMGKVRQAILVEGPGFGLNEAALSAIKGFEFHPAEVDGKPVAVKIRYGYRFVLN